MVAVGEEEDSRVSHNRKIEVKKLIMTRKIVRSQKTDVSICHEVNKKSKSLNFTL